MLPLIPDPNAPRLAPGHWAPIVVAVLALVAFLKFAAALVVPMAAAIVMTLVLAPAVQWLGRRRIPEAAGAALVVLALIGALGILGLLFAEPASRWWERAPGTLSELVERIDRVRASIPLLAPPPAPPLPARATPRSAPPSPSPAEPADPIKRQIATEGMALTRVVLAGLWSFGVSAISAILLLYFLLASEHWMLARSVQAIPRRRARALVLSGIRAAQREIAYFVGTLAIVNVGVALATWLLMWWLELPNPALWGVVAGFLNFIPYLGPILTAGMLALAGVSTFETAGAMFAPAGASLLVHFVESNVVSPFFVGRRMTLSPLAVFLSVMFFAWLWGTPGALLAVPALIGLRSFCKRRRRMRLVCRFVEGDPAPPTLRSLLRPARRPYRRGK